MSANDCTKSLRELARRILRSRGVIIRHPSEVEVPSELSLEISDLAPSLHFGLESKVHSDTEIVVSLIGEDGGSIGMKEPNISQVWIPMENNVGFSELIEQVLKLAAAGYPGCVGCGGPDAEEMWDEKSIRLGF
ncbi:MAG: hypothetical protein CMA06_01445 [Euryarchaeota archaeon]|nr:hypothetical protein [Euryarchaeota archaeon]MDC0040970.1 hypothetical protein [Candidatus Poseidoniales archaeon]MDC0149544.1 hypothetical protein [Candidatus Poseidoniales archaeon]|tara:strand:+ start:820 stop:1221 length:402 start_codon:yes stop_codon:yes gene_type:complete